MWGRLWTELELRWCLHLLKTRHSLCTLFDIKPTCTGSYKSPYSYIVRISWPTTGSGLIWPITAVIVKVTRPGNRDAAPTSTRVLIRRAGTSWKTTHSADVVSHGVGQNDNNPPFSQISVFVCVPEQVVLDSSSSFPQSLSPSHSQRRGMQRLFLHLNLSVGQVCWSGEKKGQIKGTGRKQRKMRQAYEEWRGERGARGANEWKRKQIF